MTTRKRAERKKPVKPVKAWGGWMIFEAGEPVVYETCDGKGPPGTFFRVSDVHWSRGDATERGKDVRYVKITPTKEPRS